MASDSTALHWGIRWRAAFVAAWIAVAGALAMTVVLGAAAMLAAAAGGVPAADVPLLLTDDRAFPLFCAAAGVLCALLAGYITTPAAGVAPSRHGLAAGMLTVAGHLAVVGLLGTPLPPLAIAVYVGLTLPAVCLGCWFGSPARFSCEGSRLA